MATIIVLNPMGADVTPLMRVLLRGTIPRLGDTIYKLPYLNLPGIGSIDHGVELLNDKIMSTGGEIHVFGYSEGCQVATRWIRLYGINTPVDPSRLKFTFIGNSERKYGGMLYHREFINLWADVDGLPDDDSPYPVLDFTRQYDPFADFPTYPIISEALDAVDGEAFGSQDNYLGVIISHLGEVMSDQLALKALWNVAASGMIHNWYFQVAPGDPGNVTLVEGNVTYEWAPTYPLPSVQWLSFLPEVMESTDLQERLVIERAYSRPVSMTPPVYGKPKPRKPTPTLVVGLDGAPDPVTDPISAYRYLSDRRMVIEEEAKARPLIRLWDKGMRYIGTVASEKSVDAERMLHDTGLAHIVLRGTDWLVKFLRTDVRAEEDLHITIDPYPNNRNWRWRYGAKVTNVKVRRGEDGLKTVTLECSENREHWKHLMFGATPFMPPEVQPLKAWILPANTRTGIATTGFINLARLFFPPLALADNILNPGAWVGQIGNPFNLYPLNWPIQMQFVNPLLDQSRLSVLMSRWSDAHSVTEAILKDSGCDVRVYTWLTEDEDSPHPELAALVGDDLARPTRNCFVIGCNDDSGVTGLTGTAADGAINFIAATADDLITTVLYEVVGDTEVIDPITNSPAPPLIRKLLGAAPKLPDITFRDTEYSQIVSSERNMYKSKAKHIMTGGKSPGWVNQLQTFGIKFALSQLQTAIAEGWGHNEGPAPIGSGLEEMYQGQFDDMLLSYIRFTDPVREFRVGEYGFLEHFEQGSGSAYTISSTQTLRQGHFKTRPYQSFKVSVRNGRPHRVYYDFDLGTRCLFEIDGILYTDQVTSVKLHYDEKTPKTFDLSIGDDTEAEDPLGRVARSVSNIWTAISVAFGSADLF